MGYAFTSQGIPQTACTPRAQRVRGQAPPCGLKRPPTLQTDSLVLTSAPGEGKRVYSVPLVETGPAVWGSQDPLLCWLCACVRCVCRAGMNHHVTCINSCQVPSQARVGGDGCREQPG